MIVNVTRISAWIIAATVAWAGAASAQPSPSELADRIDAANAEYIRDIERVTIVSEITEGMAKGTVSTTRFEPRERDGRLVLQAVDDSDLGAEQLTGMHDGMLADMVRHARAVERGRHEGRAVYIATIDDADFLRTVGDFQMEDEMDDDFSPREAKVWIDADSLNPLQLEFLQDGPEGGEMLVTMTLTDYRTHRGMPVAHRMRMEITGMDAMISEADKQMARQQMQQLKQQLEQMPPEQRAMIEAQLGPQMEQFEQMMASGTTEMEVRVTDVSFD